MPKAATTQTVQQIALAHLRPHPRNYQAHSAAQIAKLAASLKRFGQRKNIVAWQQDGFLYTIAGHGLVEAAQSISLTSLLANVFPIDTPEDEVLGYMVADNETARWAEPDLAQLEALLQAQLDAGYSLESVGYTLDELEALQAELEQALQPAKRAIDDPGGGGDDFDTSGAETRCKPGELWQLGKHRLLCGDSTKAEDVARLMDGEMAQMVLADPPYGMNLDVTSSDLGRGDPERVSQHPRHYTPVVGDNTDYDPAPLFALFGDTSEIFLWGGDYYADKLPSRNSGSWFVWDKRDGVEEMNFSSSSFELCWSKGKHRRDIIRKRWAGVLGMESQDTAIRMHPTQKPLEVLAWLIEHYSQAEALIVDPFLGSGTTLIACERLARRCYGLEIEPRYCDVILARWEAETGSKAVRL